MAVSQDKLSRLSPRRREVYALMQEGLTNDEIGQRLGIKRRTAETHRQTIHLLLGLHRTSPLHMLRGIPRSPDGTAPDLSTLSPRQKAVYQLVAVARLTTEATAKRLGVSPRTVEAHRAQISKRLGAVRPELRRHPTSITGATTRDALAVLSESEDIPGCILRAARAALDWSVEDVSRRAGISTSALAEIESQPPNLAKGTIGDAILTAFSKAGLTIWRGNGAFWISLKAS